MSSNVGRPLPTISRPLFIRKPLILLDIFFIPAYNFSRSDSASALISGSFVP